VAAGRPCDDAHLNSLLASRGVLAGILRPVCHAMTESWHMYPLGLLFVVGFDTATEIGLLDISAAQAVQGLSPWKTLLFPVMFTVGLMLVDTAGSVLMVGAYGWAFRSPLRKLRYNMTITAASILVVLLIGGVETLGLVRS
jgi:high-affinity nickel-transport protein